MAITLGVQESYCTEDEADALLEDNTVWEAATSEEKIAGLLAARYFIDITFNCALSDLTVIPDSLKYATALLANDYISDNTIFDSGVKIQEQEVTAGSVSSRKVFATPKANKPKSLKIVKGILKDLCIYSGGIVNLIRA